jgi:hypothetical protein
MHQSFLNKQQNVAEKKSYFIHNFLTQVSKRCLKLCLSLVNSPPGVLPEESEEGGIFLVLASAPVGVWRLFSMTGSIVGGLVCMLLLLLMLLLLILLVPIQADFHEAAVLMTVETLDENLLSTTCLGREKVDIASGRRRLIRPATANEVK